MLRFSRIHTFSEAVELDIFAFLGAYLFAILLVQGLLALIPAYFANEKGRSFGAFWALGFFATAIIALLAVNAIPHLSEAERLRRASEADSSPNPKALPCQACSEYVRVEAKVCKHCGNSVEQAFVRELKERAIRAAEFEKQTRLEFERIDAERLAAQTKFEENRKTRKAASKDWWRGFLKKPLGKISVLTSALLLLAASFALVVRVVPVATTTLCNLVTGGDAHVGKITADKGIYEGVFVAIQTPEFDCVTFVMTGYVNVKPLQGFMVDGVRFDKRSNMPGEWVLYRP